MPFYRTLAYIYNTQDNARQRNATHSCGVNERLAYRAIPTTRECLRSIGLCACAVPTTMGRFNKTGIITTASRRTQCNSGPPLTPMCQFRLDPRWVIHAPHMHAQQLAYSLHLNKYKCHQCVYVSRPKLATGTPRTTTSSSSLYVNE